MGADHPLQGLPEATRGTYLAELDSQNIEYRPGAIASSGVSIDDAAFLTAGQVLQVEHQGQWWSGAVTHVEGQDAVGIRYHGWAQSWNETVPTSRLQRDDLAFQKALVTPAAVQGLSSLKEAGRGPAELLP